MILWRKKSVRPPWMRQPMPSTSYILTVCRTSCGNRCRSAPVFSCRSALAINGRKRWCSPSARMRASSNSSPSWRCWTNTPILTAEQLKLAAWMRERLYCTYFDCVHAMLPAGLWFKRNETYTLAPDADLAALRERDGEDGQVLALFEQPGQTLSVSEIRDRLGKGRGADAGRAGRRGDPHLPQQYGAENRR